MNFDEAGFDMAVPTSLEQDVYEIELLLDFISGRQDRHLSGLDKKVQDLTADKAIEKFYVCRAEVLDNIPVLASNASFIIQLKDALNNMAWPARGLTVAYTTMFSVKTQSNRLHLAEKAFPGLVENAAKFRSIKAISSWACILVTIIGAVLLWQAFYGEQLASNFQAARLADHEAGSRLLGALNAGTKDSKSYDLDSICSLDQSQKRGKSNDGMKSSLIQLECDNYAFAHAKLCAAVHDVGAYGYSHIFSLASIFLPAHKFGASACASSPDKYSPGQQEDSPTLLNIMTVVSNYLLPILFGLSGSLAAFLRILQEKVRDNILSPRDSAMTFIRVPLGIIAGIAVGLFYNGSTPENAVHLSGVFSLSSAGIAFMAGYAADAFFSFLDLAINRLFSLNDSPNVPKTSVVP